jgi:hypothetical protein
VCSVPVHSIPFPSLLYQSIISYNTYLAYLILPYSILAYLIDEDEVQRAVVCLAGKKNAKNVLMEIREGREQVESH